MPMRACTCVRVHTYLMAWTMAWTMHVYGMDLQHHVLDQPGGEPVEDIVPRRNLLHQLLLLSTELLQRM